MERMLSLLRSCIEDYHMIEEGDRIAVGVSGGKDSLTLLVLMAALRRFYPKQFELEAISVDMGLDGMDFSPVETLCRQLNVPYTLVHTEIAQIIFEYRKEKNPCSMCAKMRRGVLDNEVIKRGFNKLAMGHHYDDAVETFMMSLIFEGRLSCFQPVTYLDRSGVTQIRPMLYLTERAVAHFAEAQQLPVVHNTCPADKHTKRQEIKDLVYQLCGTYPDFKQHIFGAMQKLPLPEWGTASKKQLQRPQQQHARNTEHADADCGKEIHGEPDAGQPGKQIQTEQTQKSQKPVHQQLPDNADSRNDE